MEYLITPVILFLLLRFGLPALVRWFFERFVEPQAETARQQQRPTTENATDTSNAQKIAVTRKDLDALEQRLDDTQAAKSTQQT